MKRNTGIGLVLAALLAGVSRIDAEPLDRTIRRTGASAMPTASAPDPAQAPSSFRRLIDSLRRLSITPVDVAPVKRTPLGLSDEDTDLPPCDEIPDPSVPCRVKAPIYG